MHALRLSQSHGGIPGRSNRFGGHLRLRLPGPPTGEDGVRQGAQRSRSGTSSTATQSSRTGGRRGTEPGTARPVGVRHGQRPAEAMVRLRRVGQRGRRVRRVGRARARPRLRRLRETSGKDPLPVSFAGYTYDTESGLYYLRNRYLEPATGRFTTPDPAGVWEDGRNKGNAYTYAGNNPVTFVDPTGRSSYTATTPAVARGQGRELSRWSTRIARRPVVTSWAPGYAGRSGPRGRRASGVFLLGERLHRHVVTRHGDHPHPGEVLVRRPGQRHQPGLQAGDLGHLGRRLRCHDVRRLRYRLRRRRRRLRRRQRLRRRSVGTSMCATASSTTDSVSMQAGILIHELSHAYNDTADYFYYLNVGSNRPWNSLMRRRRCGRTPTATGIHPGLLPTLRRVDGGQV